MTKHPSKICLVGVIACSALAFGTTTTAAAEAEKKNLDLAAVSSIAGDIDMNATYVLPRPATVFDLMEDKQFRVAGKVEFNRKTDYPGYAQSALNFGMRSTDGIVLLLSDDDDSQHKLPAVGNTLLDFTEQFGLRNKLSKEIDALADAIEENNPSAIQDSFDELFANAVAQFRQGDDTELAILFSLGGWIETLYHSSKGLSEEYSRETADMMLAHQDIVDVYISSISGLDGYPQEEQLLESLLANLKAVKDIMDRADKELDQEAVRKLLDVSSAMKTRIERTES